MTVYIEKSQAIPPKFLELVNLEKLQAHYLKTKLNDQKIKLKKKTLIIAPGNILNWKSTKCVQDLYAESYKAVLKEIKERGDIITFTVWKT